MGKGVMKKLLLSLGLLGSTVFGSGFFGGGGGGAIGGSVVGGLDCSILFVHPATILAQDQANLCWDAVNHRLGLGVMAPSVQLHTNGGVRFAALSTGIGHFDANGVLSSSAINLASADVTNTLPVNRGGTGLTSGTSGGILGFTAAGTLASSGALTANALLLGGGAGATPSSLASLGTTTTVLHGNAAGAPTFGAVSLTADVSGILPVANGGSGTSTAFTPGSVVFAGASGVFSQDNANLFFDNTQNYLGIGTASPSNPLHVNGNARLGGLFLDALGAADSGVLRYDDTNEVFGGGLITNNDIDSSANISLAKLAGGTIRRVIITSSGPGLSQAPAGTAGQLFRSFGVASDPTWSTAIYANTYTSGTMLWADASNSVAGNANITATSGGALTAVAALRSNASLILEEPDAGTNTVTMAASNTTGTYALTLPVDDGTPNQVLATDGSGLLSWANALTNPMSVAGDIIYGGASGTPTRLAGGSAGQNLKYGGATTPLWVTAAPDSAENYSLAASVGASAMTIALKDAAGNDASATSPIYISFRNATAATGTPTVIAVTGALSVVIPSGATMGTTSALEAKFNVGVINNAGTVELVVSGLGASTTDGRVTSTTIDTASDTATTFYSTTGRSNVAYRLLGAVVNTQATAGTYATSPSAILLKGSGIDFVPATSDWVSFSPTISWVAGVGTVTGLKRRNGPTMEYQVNIPITGAVTAANLLSTVPDGLTINTANLVNISADRNRLGSGNAVDAGTASYDLMPVYSTTTVVKINYITVDAVPIGTRSAGPVTQAAPTAWGNTDEINFKIQVPIAGWFARDWQ